MKNIKKLPFIAISIMVIMSFANLFGLKIAGISVIIGVIFFFINNANEKQLLEDSGLNFLCLYK